MKELKLLIEKVKSASLTDLEQLSALIDEFDGLANSVEKADNASKIDYCHYKGILLYSSVNFDSQFASKASAHRLSYEEICTKMNILIDAISCYNKSIQLKAAFPKAKTYSKIDKSREARKACAKMVFEISSFE